MNRVLFLLMVFLAVLGNSKAQVIHSLWLDKPVVLDGNPYEWPQPFRYYDGATKLQFAFANDSANLYVCIKITDEQTQMRLFGHGLNVWVDPKGKHKEASGINFPMKIEGSTGEPGEGGKHHKQSDGGIGLDRDPSTERSNILRLKQHAFLQQLTLRIKGFISTPDQVLALQNNYGINAAFNWDSLNTLCIEYKFPIALILGHNLSVADTLKPVGVGMVEPAIEVKTGGSDESALSNQSDMGGHGGMGGQSGGMGGQSGGMGGRGGGMGGGRGGSSMGNGGFNPANQEQKTWSKVILNYK